MKSRFVLDPGPAGAALPWNGLRAVAATILLWTALAAAGGSPLSAQLLDLGGDPVPPELVPDLLAFVNDAATVRIEGDAVIPADRRVEGSLALVGGTFSLDGTVTGSVVVLNGNLTLGPGGRIDGDLVVVGGRIEGLEDGRVGGVAQLYGRALPLQRGEDGTLALRSRLPEERPGLYLGGSRFTVRTGFGYNRVEGLPVVLGPIVRTAGDRPFQLDALAIVRSESRLALDQLGYQFRVAQSFGSKPMWTVGGTAFSEVRPIEDWNVSRLSQSLSTLIFHQDLSDYYATEGWSAFLEARGETTPVTARLSYLREDHSPTIPGDPFSFLDGDEPWRPMPLVASGEASMLRADLEVDRRNNPSNPSDGWYLDTSVTWGLEGSWSVPAWASAPAGPAGAPTPISTRFSVGSLDLRRYIRIDPDSDVALRVFAGSSLNGETLPPQFQFALGGVGTLPATERFFVDCGARASDVYPDEAAFRTSYTRYGCDGVALFDLYFREQFWFDLDLRGDGPAEEDDDWRLWPRVDLDVSWIAFLSAGRGWSYAPGGVDSATLANLGGGVSVGGFGVFVAFPLGGAGDNPAVFVQFRRPF